jgi:hypothetical protein
MSEPPILQGRPATAQEEALVALWDAFAKEQAPFLDAANKRVVELVTAVLGLFLAVLAFGKEFPPPYLQGNTLAQITAVFTLICFVAALLAAVWGLTPRPYRHAGADLTLMRSELERMIDFKYQRYQLALWSFAAGCVLLALLIGALVVGA